MTELLSTFLQNIAVLTIGGLVLCVTIIMLIRERIARLKVKEAEAKRDEARARNVQPRQEPPISSSCVFPTYKDGYQEEK